MNKTKKSLLDAASELFSQKGFRDVSVGDICRQAGANQAAVNYHFQSKENLYLAVLKSLNDATNKNLPSSFDPKIPATQRFRKFIILLVKQVMDKGAPGKMFKLIKREMTEPSGLATEFIQHITTKRRPLILGLLRELAPKATPLQIELLSQSIMAQVLFAGELADFKPHSDETQLIESIHLSPEHRAEFLIHLALAGINSINALSDTDLLNEAK